MIVSLTSDADDCPLLGVIDVIEVLRVYLLMSGLIIHQELLPELSFCTRIKRLCKERLCLIEFLKIKIIIC